MFKIKNLAISTFILGVVLTIAVYAVDLFPKTNSTENAFKDVKVQYKVTEQTTKDKTPRLAATKYRLQKSEGSWKETKTYYKSDGTVSNTVVEYAINGKGVYTVDEKNKQLIFHGQKSKSPEFSESDVKSSEQFGGEYSVAGIRTFLLNVKYGNDSAQTYAAPDFNGLFLKTIFKSENNTTSLEATDVKIEPISDAEFGTLPDYPINYDSYRKKISAVESVNPKQAEQLKRAIPNNE